MIGRFFWVIGIMAGLAACATRPTGIHPFDGITVFKSRLAGGERVSVRVHSLRRSELPAELQKHFYKDSGEEFDRIFFYDVVVRDKERNLLASAQIVAPAGSLFAPAPNPVEIHGVIKCERGFLVVYTRVNEICVGLIHGDKLVDVRALASAGRSYFSTRFDIEIFPAASPGEFMVELETDYEGERAKVRFPVKVKVELVKNPHASDWEDAMANYLPAKMRLEVGIPQGELAESMKTEAVPTAPYGLPQWNE